MKTCRAPFAKTPWLRRQVDKSPSSPDLDSRQTVPTGQADCVVVSLNVPIIWWYQYDITVDVQMPEGQ
jgi:hypothetical protein